MFKFLKEKLGSWIQKTKEKIELKEEPKAEETKKEKSREKKKKLKETEKSVEAGIKEEQREEKAEEIKKERETTSKVLDDIKKEGIEIKTPEQELIDIELKKAEKNLKKTEEEFEKIKGEKKSGFFTRLKEIFVYKLNKEEFNEIFEELEMILLENNVAIEVTEKIKNELETRLVGKEIKKQDIEKEIKQGIKKILEDMIIEPDDIIEIIKKIKEEKKGPFKIVFFGINGAGKTTAIAKFARLLQKKKISCVLAAGDTFRAASIEQLQIHADNLGVKMIKQNYNSDPAAVAFDAIKYAESHKINAVLIDTAGRMHTKDDLLREMEKICRIAKPDLKIFVAEAIAGNDAVEQARSFNNAIQIDGAILSKTDIDEKGGTIISISYITKKPIFYLGTGQNYDDLKLFNKEEFIKQLGF